MHAYTSVVYPSIPQEALDNIASALVHSGPNRRGAFASLRACVGGAVASGAILGHPRAYL